MREGTLDVLEHRVWSIGAEGHQDHLLAELTAPFEQVFGLGGAGVAKVRALEDDEEGVAESSEGLDEWIVAPLDPGNDFGLEATVARRVDEPHEVEVVVFGAEEHE